MITTYISSDLCLQRLKFCDTFIIKKVQKEQVLKQI